MGLQPEPLEDHRGEEEQGDRSQDQGDAKIPLLRRLALGIHHFTSGGFSKVWNGAGLGTVHSRPSAPSHGFASAFAPPRMVGSTTANRKYTCDRPKPKAPIDTSMFQSVNTPL